MQTSRKVSHVKPGITAEGFRRAVKDYTEPAVVEELAANSYDADASTALVLIDTDRNELHVIDDGSGFSRKAIVSAGILGGGDKTNVDYSRGKRPYLGAYGFGLKATANIASRVRIESVSQEGTFEVEVDWSQLDEALKPGFVGYELMQTPTKRNSRPGTHITLSLLHPTSEEQLDGYVSVLGNLPTDNGKFKCYVGLIGKTRRELNQVLHDFSRLKPIAAQLARKRILSLAEPSASVDLARCKVAEGHDRVDKKVGYKIYFTGIEDGKVMPLKPGLRGIYVRINGRLLKHSFTEQKYVYPISKWVKFASGLRVELSIDWLRSEISLSRDNLRFSNEKLEEQFRTTLTRVVSAFILPQVKKLERKAARKAIKVQEQRRELANRRLDPKTKYRLKTVHSGFAYVPETDGELALLISNPEVIHRVNKYYQLVSYDGGAPTDCIIYDATRREQVHTELEPTLMEFLQHKTIPPELSLVIVWTLGKWRVGARKRAKSSFLKLVNDRGSKPGHYRLLVYSTLRSKEPKSEFAVVVLDEVLRSDG